LIGEPVVLPEALRDAFPELTAVHVRCGGLPPRVGGWCLGRSSVAAITLWRTVWIHPGTPLSAELLLHEFCHVRQFEADRWFPLRYIGETLRRGYRSNRYELTAREYARAGVLRTLADLRVEDD
jgi:hypothetical protein